MDILKKVCFRKRHHYLEGPDLQKNIDDLHNYFMPLSLDPNFYKSKVRAIATLNHLLKSCGRHNLQDSDFEELLLCSLTLIFYFGMRLRTKRPSRCRNRCDKKLFNKAESTFQKTMDLLHPERGEMAIKITLNFFSEVDLWPFENFVGQILEVVLYFNRGNIMLFNLMLTDIHYVLFNDVTSARHRMRVLYELLNSENWIIDKQKLLPFITRLLDFFAYSINKNSNVTAYGYLRKGFEVCLRRIFERVENQHRILIITTILNWFSLVSMDDDDVLNFSSLLDHAAELFQVSGYSESFKEGLIDHVLHNLVGSENSLYSLIGCRLLQRFLDRQHNAAFLTVPTIYYEFSQVRLKVGICDIGDKLFMRQYRNKLHKYILHAVKQHCSRTMNLKGVFSLICCIVLEVPCELTAAIAACMVMTIQDFAINGENLYATSRYWMHAIVTSVMSLICWTHKAPMLYRYVNQIISRRAKEAPQLNPPLMHNYKICHHHVTWNKPTLFFEDWELRYALWKHFQEAKPPQNHSPMKWNKKVPLMDMSI